MRWTVTGDRCEVCGGVAVVEAREVVPAGTVRRRYFCAEHEPAWSVEQRIRDDERGLDR